LISKNSICFTSTTPKSRLPDYWEFCKESRIRSFSQQKRHNFSTALGWAILDCPDSFWRRKQPCLLRDQLEKSHKKKFISLAFFKPQENNAHKISEYTPTY
jgi:hypothetical protein